MLFRDKFEIKPTQFLDGHTDPNSFDLIKWYNHKPMKVLSITQQKEIVTTRSCYSVATLRYNEKEPCWEIESVGMRLMEDWEDGLDKYILKWCEFMDACRGGSDER